MPVSVTLACWHWHALPYRPRLCTGCNIWRDGGRHCGPGDCIQYYQYYLLEYYIILPILHNITDISVTVPGEGLEEDRGFRLDI